MGGKILQLTLHFCGAYTDLRDFRVFFLFQVVAVGMERMRPSHDISDAPGCGCQVGNAFKQVREYICPALWFCHVTVMVQKKHRLMYGVGVGGNYGVEQKYVAGWLWGLKEVWVFIAQCHVLLQVSCLNSISMHPKKSFAKLCSGEKIISHTKTL